ncbi:hypothetical protein ABVK25_006626 [Lepraria finkii]|uniref:Uncharacterized protein n=1 Tax=Lepraria finkii TaxID=1340010 RepID=A0ABR4B560_9LECA
MVAAIRQGSTQQGSIQARDGNTTITAEPPSVRDVQLPRRLATTAQEAEEQELDTEANAYFTTSAGACSPSASPRRQATAREFCSHYIRTRSYTRCSSMGDFGTAAIRAGDVRRIWCF